MHLLIRLETMTEKETKTTAKKKGKKTKEETAEVPKEETEKETKKKGSKLIPKPKVQENIIDSTAIKSQTEIKKHEKDVMTPMTNTESESITTLPNVVVRLRCQLSDLSRPVIDENQISNPYEYKAWVPSEIKTYNTTDFQAGSLSMEPINFIGLETLNGSSGKNEVELAGRRTK